MYGTKGVTLISVTLGHLLFTFAILGCLDLAAKLDFNRDIAPIIDFLNDIGVTIDNIGKK